MIWSFGMNIYENFTENSEQILIYWLLLEIGKGSKDKENRHYMCTVYFRHMIYMHNLIKFT